MSFPIIKTVEYEKHNLDGYTIIEGFPGLGLVGTICAKYLIEKMEFEEIAHIESEIFVPMIRIEKGLPVYPARICINKENKIGIILSEQIIPKAFAYYFANHIVNWIKEKRVKRIISIEGIHSDEEIKTQKIYAIAANEKSLQIAKSYGLEIVENGITTGITTMIMTCLKSDKNIEAFTILPNIKNIADYKGAAEVIKILNKILSLNISVEPLLKEAKETEKALIKQIEELKKTTEAIDKFESKSPSMYT